MTPKEVKRTPQEQQQLYLKRINQFFAQVKNWLSDDFETIPTENYLVEDETGKYQTLSLSIVRKEIPKPNNKIVDLFPKGTSVLMGEGFIEVHGVYGEESFIYMLKDGWVIQDRFGQIRPMYKEVKTDGWYWLESYHRNKASLVDKEVLMDVLKTVTLYDEP
ncbi:hypothetical protein BGP_5891 [Beggiatoa sp. PS]|nr:hypothetical protein BGP_5891 [Beggiatoa sp. PS]